MILSEEDDKILKYNQDKKIFKNPFIIYADTELLLEEIPTHDTNSKESSTTKISKHTACGYSLFTHCSFDSSRSKHNFYRRAYCMKKFCGDLKKHAA